MGVIDYIKNNIKNNVKNNAENSAKNKTGAIRNSRRTCWNGSRKTAKGASSAPRIS